MKAAQPTLLVLAWLWVGLFATYARLRLRRRQGREERIARMRAQPPTQARAVPAPAARPPAPSVLVSWVGRLVLSARHRQRWREWLQAAYLHASPERYVGRVTLTALAAGAAAWLLASALGLPVATRLLLGSLVLVGTALWFPVHLRTLRDQRRQDLLEVLPDFFDFLAVSLAAGLTLEAALGYVIPQLEGVARDAFGAFWQELHVGSSRREAVTRLAQRSGLEALERFALLIVQADQLGTGMHDALRAEADRLRTERLARARERAGRLPVQLTLPIVLFFLPALYALLLGPALLDVLHSLGGRL